MIAAIAIVAVHAALASAQPESTPRVRLHSDDDALTGAIALYLVEDGAIVTPDSLEATHELTIGAPRDGGYVVTCLGAETKGAVINAGTPALVEIELRQRVASLVRTTKPRDVAEGPIARVNADIVDKRASTDERLSGRTAHALLDQGISLAPLELADERLCVDAGPITITISWGPRCEGRPVGVARDGVVPRVLVSEALRLREAAPLPTSKRNEYATPPPQSPPPAAPAPVPGERSLAAPSTSTSTSTSPSPSTSTSSPSPPSSSPSPSTSAAATPPRLPPPAPATTTPPSSDEGTPLMFKAYNPFQLSLRAGGLARPTALDPRASLTAYYSFIQGAGPIAQLDFSGATDPVLVGEGFTGAGIALVWHPQTFARLRAGIGVMGGAWTHGWYFADDDWGFAFDPAAIVPAWIDVAVVPGWHVSFAAEGGALGRDRIHEIRGAPVWSRGGFSLAFSLGLTVDIPGPPSGLEN